MVMNLAAGGLTLAAMFAVIRVFPRTPKTSPAHRGAHRGVSARDRNARRDRSSSRGRSSGLFLQRCHDRPRDRDRHCVRDRRHPPRPPATLLHRNPRLLKADAWPSLGWDWLIKVEIALPGHLQWRFRATDRFFPLKVPRWCAVAIWPRRRWASWLYRLLTSHPRRASSRSTSARPNSRFLSPM